MYRNFLLPEEQTEAEAKFLLRRLRPRSGARWLDLPCGFGRHLEALKRLRPGLCLTGADLQQRFLREPGLCHVARLTRCDMRHLPFAEGSFHGVYNLLNSFGYYPPPALHGPARLSPAARDAGDISLLKEWRRVLRRGGRLVLDLSNRRPLIDIVRRAPRVHYAGGEYEAVEEFAWDARDECLRNRTRWRWEGGAEEGSYRVRLYTPRQIQALLRHAGFHVEELHGDFNGGPFDARRSDRMIVIARRV